jgi:hypothetical protein
MDLSKFDVFPVSSSRTRVSAISITKNGVTIPKKSISLMKNPKAIKILINKQDKQIAFQAGSADDRDSIARDPDAKSVYGFKTTSKDLLAIAADFLGTPVRELSHRVEPKWIEENKLLVIDLKEAVRFSGKPVRRS